MWLSHGGGECEGPDGGTLVVCVEEHGELVAVHEELAEVVAIVQLSVRFDLGHERSGLEVQTL